MDGSPRVGSTLTNSPWQLRVKYIGNNQEFLSTISHWMSPMSGPWMRTGLLNCSTRFSKCPAMRDLAHPRLMLVPRLVEAGSDNETLGEARLEKK